MEIPPTHWELGFKSSQVNMLKEKKRLKASENRMLKRICRQEGWNNRKI
jgi:hypothetical protein